jgi:hypothetical protein
MSSVTLTSKSADATLTATDKSPIVPAATTQGVPMGLLLSLTYATTQTVSTWTLTNKN